MAVRRRGGSSAPVVYEERNYRSHLAPQPSWLCPWFPVHHDNPTWPKAHWFTTQHGTRLVLTGTHTVRLGGSLLKDQQQQGTGHTANVAAAAYVCGFAVLGRVCLSTARQTDAVTNIGVGAHSPDPRHCGSVVAVYVLVYSACSVAPLSLRHAYIPWCGSAEVLLPS